ncbi:uncharacterized protein JCM6883_006638 [Sporobolomyces salmoneus]|uniref:uncharacterized protein n=1 Tax=Sporobolomyces salmoneus TaxID=183962 RepID=UPI00317B0FE7
MSALPLPVSTSTNHPRRFSSTQDDTPRRVRLRGSFSFIGNRAKLLTQRARTTNLAVLILAFVALVSLWFNATHMVQRIFPYRTSTSLVPSVPRSLQSTLTPAHSDLSHLVMIPGHAIWQGCDASHSTRDQDWILQDFQKDGKHVKTYLKHLTKGAEIAVQDPKALLVFSGGQTRPDATLTEALSYLRLSKFGNIFSQFMSDSDRKLSITHEFDRVTTEDYAMDSFQNLLFSIARFKEFTGRYPSYITVIGYGMKSARFTSLHRKALRWPVSAFDYIGIDNEGETSQDYEGEKQNGFKPFEKDLYGCHDFLGEKRKSRNPYRRFHGYHSSAPELRGLLEFCPDQGDKVFDGRLPWDLDDDDDKKTSPW